MSGGWPNRINRSALGPTYENSEKITNPAGELDAAVVNLLAWQFTALNCGPRVFAIVQVDGSDLTVVYQWSAWDPEGAQPRMTWVTDSNGNWSWDLGSTTFADKDGVEQPVNGLAAQCVVQAFAGQNFVMTANVGASGSAGTAHAYTAHDGVSTSVDRFAFFMW